MGTYSGPVIDAHTHLWSLKGDNYPWLRRNGVLGSSGKFDRLKGADYVMGDFDLDVGNEPVVAAVNVEALWDPDLDQVNETRWLDSQIAQAGRSNVIIAGAPFGAGEAVDTVRQQFGFSRVRGVRQTIAWTPDPAFQMAAKAGLLLDPEWRAPISELDERGGLLELLMYPEQHEDVAQLASEHPGLRIVLNHGLSPIHQDHAGVRAWELAVSEVSAYPNVFVKVSAIETYLGSPSVGGMMPFVARLLASFGPSRAMFGSDFPVSKLAGWSYAQTLSAYRKCAHELSEADQFRFFYETARELYDFRSLDGSDA